MIFSLLGISRQIEVLIITLLGIFSSGADLSVFHLKPNLEEVWKIELDKARYLEIFVKHILGAVVLTQGVTLHLYLGSYILALWPALFDNKPNLMLPWLFLGIVRCLTISVTIFCLGSFICHKEKGLHPICLEFILAEIIESGPSIYAWFAMLSYYRELAAVHIKHSESEDSSLYEKQDNNEAPETSSKSSSSSSSPASKHSPGGSFENLASSKSLDKALDQMFSDKQPHISTRSFDSLLDRMERKNLLESHPYEKIFTSINTKEKIMKLLDISDDDISKAKETGEKLVNLLEEVSLDDYEMIGNELPTHPIASKRFYVQGGKVFRGSKMDHLKSHSANEALNQGTCTCFVKRRLEKEQSNQSLVETEIANIEFDISNKLIDEENEEIEHTKCRANQ